MKDIYNKNFKTMKEINRRQKKEYLPCSSMEEILTPKFPCYSSFFIDKYGSSHDIKDILLRSKKKC